MTIRFRHRGCTSVAIVFCGEGLVSGLTLRSDEWALPDGRSVRETIGAGGLCRLIRCPDCGAALDPPGSRLLEQIQKGESRPTP